MFFKRKEAQDQLDQKKKLPPGQSLTQKWPVLHVGSVPRFNPAAWDFKYLGPG
ncbi:MAG: sulfite oxidase-like oxidoreductase, partial [Anaerolineales bacterium]|nr:sulfite oxidase-like oxidoreductase [Anaerolineales bacterium]